jgi:hypothetical protein
MSALSALGQMGQGGGLQQLAGAAAPMVKNAMAPSTAAAPNQGIANAAANPSVMESLDPNATNSAASGVAAMAGGGEVGIANSHPMAEGQHPVWGLLHHIAGAKQAIPSANHPVATMAKGGVVTPVSKMPPTGPLPANFGGAKNYENGGAVSSSGGPVYAGNFGGPTLRPDFNRGPAGKSHGIPVDARGVGPANMRANGVSGMAQGGPVMDDQGANTSMGQGITPASPEGQVLTMDQGGQVPPLGMPQSGTNWTPPPAMSQPQVAGRSAGFASGLGSGMALGKDLRDQWQQHEARTRIEGAQSAQEKSEMDAYHLSHGLPTGDQQAQGQTGVMGMVHNYTSKFFDMLHGKTIHDDGEKLNDQPLPGSTTAQQGQAVQAPPAAGAPTPPAPPGAVAPGGTPPAPPGQPGQPAPVPGASGAPGTPAPAAPPAGAAPGGAAAPPAPPPPGTPAAAAVKAQAGAIQAGADPVQAGQTAASVGTAAASLTPNSTPAQVPGKGGMPESLTQKDWEDTERAKWKAARAATAAGMDGNQVYESLSQLQTAHFQGQYVKWIGNATQALQNGDQEGVEKSLRAASYYLPNGQPLQLHKATDEDVANDKSGQIQKGQFIVQNPFYGMPGHDGTTEPRQVGITPMSLAAMGQAALDPVAFGTGLQNQYKMGVEAQTNFMKAQAAQTQAGGWANRGQAMINDSFTRAADEAHAANLKDSEARLNNTKSTYYADVQAKKGGSATMLKPSDVRAYQTEGSTAYMNAAQGEQTTDSRQQVPNPLGLKNKDGTPVMVPNPAYGKPIRDSGNIAPAFAGQTAEEREQGAALAGELHSANPEVDAHEAALAAAAQVSFNRDLSRGVVQQHTDPQTKKPARNVVQDQATGADGKPHPALFVWDKATGAYKHYWLTANVAQDAPAGIESGPASPATQAAPAAADEQGPPDIQ